MNLRRLCSVFLVLLFASPIGSYGESSNTVTVNVNLQLVEWQGEQLVYTDVDEMEYPYEIIPEENSVIIYSDTLEGKLLRITVDIYDVNTQQSNSYVTFNTTDRLDFITFNSSENGGGPIYLVPRESLDTGEEWNDDTVRMSVTMGSLTAYNDNLNTIPAIISDDDSGNDPYGTMNDTSGDGSNGTLDDTADDAAIEISARSFLSEDQGVDEIAIEEKTPQSIPENRETNVVKVTAQNGVHFYLSAQGEAQQVGLRQNDRFKYEEDGRTYVQTWRDSEHTILMIPVILSSGERGFVEMNGEEIAFVNQSEAAEYETSLFTSEYAVSAGAPMFDAAGTQRDYIKTGVTVQYLSGANSTLYQNRQLWIKVRNSENNEEGYIQSNLATFKTKAEVEELKERAKIEIPSNTDTLKSTTSGASVTLYSNDLITSIGTVPANADMTFLNTSFLYDAGIRAYAEVYVASTRQTGYVKMSEVSFYVPVTETETDPAEEEKTDNTSTEVNPDLSRLAYMQGARDINIRDSINGTTGRQVDAGDAVRVMQTETDSGYTWYYVEVLKSTNHPESVGYKGYVRYATPIDVLRFMTEAEENAFYIAQKKEQDEAAAAQTSPSGGETTKETATKETSSSSSLPAITQVKGYMRVTAPGYTDLNVYPAVGAARLAILSYNEVVYVDGQVYDANGNVWCITLPLYDGAPTGYVLSSSLVAMTASEVNNYFATARPSPTILSTYSPNAFSGYAVLIKNRVNFRSTPNGSAMTQLSQGTVVRVIGSTTVDGYTWYQCESGGKTGYLRSDMLSMLTISQYQQYVTTPSYDQNGSIITPTATINVGATAAVWATARPGASSTISFVTIPPLSTVTPDASGSVNPDASGSLDPNATASDGSLIADTSATPSIDPDATLPPPPDVDPTFDTQESSGFSPPGLLLAIVILLVLGGGGFYGYTVYNKTRKKQAAKQAKRSTDPSRQRGDNAPGGEKRAVRRPVPPTQPNRTGSAGGNAPGQPPRSGAAPAGAQNAAKPGTPGAQNPYARPQSQQRTQEVSSSMPRAQVDGKPVGEGKAAPASNPYARPQGQQTQPRNPAVTAGTQGQQRTPGTQGQTSANAPRTRMPIAPSPVEPDADARSMQENAGKEEAPPRRRRHRYSEDGE